MGSNPKLEYTTDIVVVHPNGVALTGGPRLIDWQAPLPVDPSVRNAVILLADGVPVAAGMDYRLTVPR